MKAIAIIVARSSGRDPMRELLSNLKGKSVIRRTYESAVNSGLFTEVIVAADDDKVINEIKKTGGKTVKVAGHESHLQMASGLAGSANADAIIVLKGNIPLIQKSDLSDLLFMLEDDENKADVISMMGYIHTYHGRHTLEDTNVVKVAVSYQNHALFFLRSIQNFRIDDDVLMPYFEHNPIYAFRKKSLVDFAGWPVSALEQAEHIEAMRLLEHGLSMRMSRADDTVMEINDYNDMYRAEDIIRNKDLE